MDDLKVQGVDGVWRAYDENYDTMLDVEDDPYGAWEAIQKQHSRIEALEAQLEEVTRYGRQIEYANAKLIQERKTAEQARDKWRSMWEKEQADNEALQAQLAEARKEVRMSSFVGEGYAILESRLKAAEQAAATARADALREAAIVAKSIER
jgi:predicted nuclease with TOPRIM domain